MGSEHQELGQMLSPQYYSHLEGKIRHFRDGNFLRSEDGLSPSHSSDYEDQDDYTNCTQQIATVHVVSKDISKLSKWFNIFVKLMFLRNNFYKIPFLVSFV